MTLGTAATELLERHGLDLEEDEAFAVLNEGHTELCVRSEWTRASVAVGPSVADQAEYAVHASIYRPLRLAVNGAPWIPSDERMVQRIQAGEIRWSQIWYLTHDSAGAEKFGLYPAPDTSGLAITAYSIVYPDTLEADDEFVIPRDFHRAPIHYARSVSLGSSEDDTDRENVDAQIFDGYVARLRRHRLSRAGRGPVHMGIEGVTA
jgi:hypothetical protein